MAKRLLCEIHGELLLSLGLKLIVRGMEVKKQQSQSTEDRQTVAAKSSFKVEDKTWVVNVKMPLKDDDYRVDPYACLHMQGLQSRQWSNISAMHQAVPSTTMTLQTL